MRTITHELKESQAIEIISDDLLFEDERSTLDLLAQVGYEYDSQNLIVHQENLPPAFLDLKSGLLGEVLHKLSIYRFRLAVIGDFEDVRSEALAAFIREANRKRQFVFASNVEEVIQTFWH